jgi:NitT/TauT family transport system substrate-binding protein
VKLSRTRADLISIVAAVKNHAGRLLSKAHKGSIEMKFRSSIRWADRGWIFSGVLIVILGYTPRLPAAEKLVFGWSAIAGSQSLPWIAKEAGLFEKHGLDATLIYLDGGSRAVQVLLSGDVPIVQGGGSAPVAARLRGGDITLIIGALNVLAYSLVVHSDIKRPEDLRGKKLAISRYGSNSDYATRRILLTKRRSEKRAT